MRNNKQNNRHGIKWNSSFMHKVTHAQIGDVNNASANIVFRYVTSAALLCDECHVRSGTTIELIRPDYGMVPAVGFVLFIISANYDLKADGDNHEL